jgi:hypothetical protein
MIQGASATDISAWMPLAKAFKHVNEIMLSKKAAGILFREKIRHGDIAIRSKIYHHDILYPDAKFLAEYLDDCAIYWEESRFSYNRSRFVPRMPKPFSYSWCDIIQVEVLSADVFRVWPSEQHASGNTAAIADAPEYKNPGGRPRKWDWEGALIEMARVAVFDERCSREFLKKAVQDWFIKSTGSEPPDSSIRHYVKRFYEALWPPKT